MARLMAIGGSWAGHAISGGGDTLVVVQRPGMDSIVDYTDPPPVTEVVKKEVYRRECFSFLPFAGMGGNRVWFWRLEGMSPHEVLLHLLANYRPLLRDASGEAGRLSSG